ncbi:MAG: hypothetical protein K0S76_3266 [Herbinix sp.]|nr:hypothetical protein [Herbinix sp.]
MKYIFIDLDGTITDPKPGITKSVQYALRAFHINIEDLDSLCCHIGPPLKTAFMEFYGFSEEQALEAIVKYREYFAETGIFENEVYEGMESLLARLKAAGKVLIVATSKPEVFARRILEHFGLIGYFDDVCGSTLDDSRSKKEEVIRYAMEKNGVLENTDVVMVGDRMHDIEGAKAVGLASIGVLYGYGSREELEKAGADRICEAVEDLYEVIMSFND